MTLWDMLDKTKYYQKVWIFETNAYGQNMPLFKGTVQDARQDTDLVWDYLMCEVESYDCEGGMLDIRVRTKYYNERLEGRYTNSDSWDAPMETRPWRWSVEIDMEKGAIKNGQKM